MIVRYNAYVRQLTDVKCRHEEMLITGVAPLISPGPGRIAQGHEINRIITRRALVKGGLIAGSLVPVASLFISDAACRLAGTDRARSGGERARLRYKIGKVRCVLRKLLPIKKTGDSTGSRALFAGKRRVRRVVQRVGEDGSPLM